MSCEWQRSFNYIISLIIRSLFAHGNSIFLQSLLPCNMDQPDNDESSPLTGKASFELQCGICEQNLSLADKFRSCRTQGDAKRGLDQYNEREGLESTQRCHTLFLRTQWYAGVVIVKATIPALHLQMLMSPMEKTLTNVILNSRS